MKVLICVLSLLEPNCLRNSVVDAKIGTTNADALLDTEASESFIDDGFMQRAGLTFFPQQSSISMVSINFKAEVLGFVNANITLLGQTCCQFQFGMLKDLCSDVILSQDFIMKLHERITFQSGGRRPSINVPNRLNGMVSVAAANVEPPQLFQFLDPGIKPVAAPSKRLNANVLVFVRQEVTQLSEKGIIEPALSPWRAQVLIEPALSPWRAQVLITKDERKKQHMVIDYSQTITQYTLLDAYPLPRMDDQVNEIAQSKVYSTLDLKSAYHQIPLLAADWPHTAFEADGKLYQFRRPLFGITNGVSTFQRIIDKIISSHKLKKTFAYLDNITVAGKDQEEHDANLKALLNVAESCDLTFNESKSVICLRN